jgi:hypothetical protein
MFSQFQLHTISKSKSLFEPWEAIRLTELVQIHGTTNWYIIAGHLPGRSARQCRQRWSNYVNPNISKHEWTESENEIVLTTYRDSGPKWCVIAHFLPGGSRNNVENRYFALQRYEINYIMRLILKKNQRMRS